MNIKSIATEDQLQQELHKHAIKELEHLIRIVGPKFHPDTDFYEYTNITTNYRTFTTEQIIAYEFSLLAIFYILSDNIYDEALAICQRLFPQYHQNY